MSDPIPAWAVDACLSVLALPGTNPKTVVPACGEGAFIRGLERHAITRVVGLDTDGEALDEAAKTTGDNVTLLDADFLAHTAEWGIDDQTRWVSLPDLVVCAPPLHLAMAYVERAAQLYSTSRRAFLMRVGILESEEYAAFDADHPAVLHILNARPSMKNGGTADSAMWAFFEYGPNVTVPGYKLLDCRPFLPPATPPRKRK